MPAAPVFELEHVSRHYGAVQALADVSLRIVGGERVALIGPSGAGKSTLIGLLNGTVSPSAGRVQVLGHDLTGLSGRARRGLQRQIGTVYQQFNLVDNLRVVHNINAGHLARWSLPKALLSLVWPLELETARRALEQVGIADKLFARTGHLSGGEQQRVALARVLVQDPVAILADEPIAQLDPERGREIMDLFFGLSAQTHKTLVASLHAIEYTRSHFGRVVGLRRGRVQFDVPADGVTPAMLENLYQIGHAEAAA